jgi:hypothetical protein
MGMPDFRPHGLGRPRLTGRTQELAMTTVDGLITGSEPGAAAAHIASGSVLFD